MNRTHAARGEFQENIEMMKSLIFAGAFLASGAASACFLSGEQTSGMNKICFYNCVSGTKAITVSAVSMCPLSISQAPKSSILAKYAAPGVVVAHSGGH